MENLQEWVKRLIGNDSINAAAKKSGINQSTLNRQVTSGKISVETIIALAGGYGISRCRALVETGFITNSDIAQAQAKQALAKASDEEIARELSRRMAEGRAHLNLSNCDSE